jgi:hypothetical protein
MHQRGWLRVVERREHAIAQQKSVCDVRGIGVCPDDVAFGINRSGTRKRRPWKINRGERPVVSEVSVTHSSTICGKTDDRTRWVHSAGSAADCAGWIET